MVIVISILMILVFLLAGCKAVEEEPPEEVAEPVEEEAVVEEPIEEEPAVVTIGHDGTVTVMDYMEKVLEEVEEDLPNIEIQQITYPTYDDMLTMIPAQIAAGTIPDIVWWDAVAAPEYIRQDVVEPIDEWLTPDFNIGEYLPVLTEVFKYEEKLYGIPLHANCSSLVINRDMYQEAGIEDLPQSVDEFREGIVKISNDTDNIGVVVMLNAFHIGQYVIAHGGSWNYGKTINSKENVEGVQFLVDLFVKEKAALTAKELGAGWDGEAFAKGNVGASTGGPWYIGFMAAVAPEINYTLHPFPGKNSGDVTIYTYGAGYSLMKNAENKAAAVKVLEYLSSDKAQELLYTTDLKFIPAKEKMISNYIEVVPEFAPLEEAFFEGVELAYPMDQKGFSDDLTAGVEQLIYSPDTAGTVQELLDSLQQKYGSDN